MACKRLIKQAEFCKGKVSLAPDLPDTREGLTEAEKKAVRHGSDPTSRPDVPICRHTKGKTSVFTPTACISPPSSRLALVKQTLAMSILEAVRILVPTSLIIL